MTSSICNVTMNWVYGGGGSEICFQKYPYNLLARQTPPLCIRSFSETEFVRSFCKLTQIHFEGVGHFKPGSHFLHRVKIRAETFGKYLQNILKPDF